jgi:hypothetical protein
MSFGKPVGILTHELKEIRMEVISREQNKYLEKSYNLFRIVIYRNPNKFSVGLLVTLQ